jgi:hypothetical protein
MRRGLKRRKAEWESLILIVFIFILIVTTHKPRERMATG